MMIFVLKLIVENKTLRLSLKVKIHKSFEPVASNLNKIIQQVY